ncbi:MAG: hypothetical protein QG652_1126 [Pseudomonadota bacterium]|nr:hypothetical protein [Pseudomonadota bacterium]
MPDKIKRYLSRVRWFSILLQLVLFAVILFAISAWQTRHATRGNAPVFSGLLLPDKTPAALQDYRGKPLLLYFWASWCPVCKLEQDVISALVKSGADNDFQVLTIASWSGNEAEVMQILQRENLHFPVIVDQDGRIAALYGVNSVPSSFVMDGQGVVQFVEQGYTTQAGFRWRLWWVKNN